MYIYNVKTYKNFLMQFEFHIFDPQIGYKINGEND